MVKQEISTFLILNLNLTWKVEGHGQSPPKTIGILTRVVCTSDPNLMVLAWMGDELRCGQTQHGVNLDFRVKSDLLGQGRSFHKTIEILTNVFYTSDPNLVIFAWIRHELSREQASDCHTHTDIHEWLSINKLSLNVKKTKFMIFITVNEILTIWSLTCKSIPKQ